MDYLVILLEVDIWKYLSIEDISHLCQSNQQFKNICQDNYGWKFLLQRDFFKKSVEDNVRQQYIKYYEIINFFGSKFRILTDESVDVIDKFLPKIYWRAFIKYKKHFFPHYICDLSFYVLYPVIIVDIMGEMRKLIQAVDLWNIQKEMEEITGIRRIRQQENVDIEFKAARNYINNNNDTERSVKILYVNKIPKLLDINFGFMKQLQQYITETECSDIYSNKINILIYSNK